MSCRYDRATKTHLTRAHKPDCNDVLCKGCQPCTHDDHGNPVRHCRARQRCTSHLGWTEATCPVCVGKIRANLTRITNAMALMPAEVEHVGRTDRTAAAHHVPGGTAHPGSWRARMRHNAINGRHVDDPDQNDPWQMLAVRERMIREDLGHDRLLVSPTLAGTCGYLAWVLTDLARDFEQVTVVAELVDETSRLADHLEAILRDSRKPERGAPCRSCPAPAPRLQLHRGHWCTDPECDKDHHQDDTGDRWVCPVDDSHWWSAEDYRRWVYADAHDSASERIHA